MQSSKRTSAASHRRGTVQRAEIVEQRTLVAGPRPKRKAKKSTNPLHGADTLSAGDVNRTLNRFRYQHPNGPMSMQFKGCLKPRLNRWLQCLSRPFEIEAVKCPVNFNPMPTLQTSLWTTTSTLKVNAPSGQNVQFTLYPGHTLLVDADEMDGPSYHQNWQNVNGVVRPVAPVQYADASAVIRNGFNAVMSLSPVGTAGVGTNSVVNDTSTSASTVIEFDNALPLSGTPKDSSHTRYKLVGMGIRFSNETPGLTRGGTFMSVQPLTTNAYANIQFYAKHPTFKDHGLCDEKRGELSWIPRIQDLAFYHPSTSTAVTIGVGTAGILLCFVNTTAAAQNLAVEIVYHWEIGGSNVIQVSTGSVQFDSDKNIVSPTISLLQQGAATAAPAAKVAEVVATVAPPRVETPNLYGGKSAQEWFEFGTGKIVEHLGKMGTAKIAQMLGESL